MSSFEKLIGDAIMNPDKQQISMDRVECKFMASRQMFCSCGTILDQKTIQILNNKKLEDKVKGAVCPKCAKKAEKIMRDNKITEVFEWITWKGRKQISKKEVK